MSKKEQIETVCHSIIQCLLAEGYRFQVPHASLEKCIMYRRGIDERTVKRWIKALITFGYLEPIARNVYQLNPIKIPQLAKLLKEHPQTKVM